MFKKKQQKKKLFNGWSLFSLSIRKRQNKSVKGSWQLCDLSHFQSHGAERWRRCLFVCTMHTHIDDQHLDPYQWGRSMCVCVFEASTSDFCRTVSSWTSADCEVCFTVLWSGSLFQGSPLPQSAICVCVCVCVCLQAGTNNALSSVCILDKPGCGGLLCKRWEDEALFSEDISVPCLHPRTSFFLLMIRYHFSTFFRVLSAFYDIKCLCARGVAGWIRWTLQHWKLFVWGFDLRSAPLYFARTPLAAFTFVSPLLVRPIY